MQITEQVLRDRADEAIELAVKAEDVLIRKLEEGRLEAKTLAMVTAARAYARRWQEVANRLDQEENVHPWAVLHTVREAAFEAMFARQGLSRRAPFAHAIALAEAKGSRRFYDRTAPLFALTEELEDDLATDEAASWNT